MHELALSPDVAQVPENAGYPGAAELSGRRTLNDVTIALTSRGDQYVVLSVAVLEKLEGMTLDRTKVAFRETGREGVQVLMRVPRHHAKYPKRWQPVLSKELFRTYRITTGEHVEVVYG